MKPLLSLAAILVSTSGAWGCCDSAVTKEISSPDGLLTATLFVKNCGATVDYVSTVNVHSKADGFRDDRGAVFVVTGRQEILLSWPSENALLIRCPSCTRKDVFRQMTVLADTDVRFEIGSPPGIR